MDNPVLQELEKLPKKTLIDLVKMYSRNWMTLDGLWFSGVEERYGLDAAMDIDTRMWQIGSMIEAKRIKELLKMGRGLENILRAINFMSWAASFGYEYDLSTDKAVWTCRHCPPQEQRIKAGNFSIFTYWIRAIIPKKTVMTIATNPEVIKQFL